MRKLPQVDEIYHIEFYKDDKMIYRILDITDHRSIVIEYYRGDLHHSPAYIEMSTIEESRQLTMADWMIAVMKGYYV